MHIDSPRDRTLSSFPALTVLLSPKTKETLWSPRLPNSPSLEAWCEHAHHPSLWEVEAGESEVQSQPGLYRVFMASQTT